MMLINKKTINFDKLLKRHQIKTLSENFALGVFNRYVIRIKTGIFRKLSMVKRKIFLVVHDNDAIIGEVLIS